MKWSHLPVAGGLYDQHPDLIEGFKIIFMLRNQHEAKEQKKRDAEARRGKGGSRVAGRRG